MDLFKLAEDRHAEIIKGAAIKKEAILGAVLGKGLMGGLGYVIRNPLKTLGGVFTAGEVAGAAKKGSNIGTKFNMVSPIPRGV
jgi:hypothetical protein